MRTIAAPCRRGLLQQPVDLALGADVDAAGRLGEDEHVDAEREDASEDDLLLVAARERGDAARRGGGDHAVARDRVATMRRSARVSSRPLLERRPFQAIEKFSATLRVGRSAERLRSSGTKPIPPRERRARVAQRDLACRRPGRCPCTGSRRRAPCRAPPCRSPTRPATPRISPRRTCSDVGRSAPFSVASPSTSSTASPCRSRAWRSSRRARGRPSSTRVGSRCVSGSGTSPTSWPSRRTVAHEAAA